MSTTVPPSSFVRSLYSPCASKIKRFEKSKKKLIVCLDEIDLLKDAEILYVLARNSCGLVLISNQAHALSNVDNRIASSLFLQEVEFKPYNKEEILEILKERANFGLRPDSITNNLLSIVSGISGGDARVGLQTLKIAAKDAESKDLEKISMQEIKSAIKCARKYKLSYLLGKLNERQKMIYEILQKSREIGSGKLLEECNKSTKEKIPERSYRSYMQRMEELGLVREIGSKRGRKYEIVI